MKRIYPMLYQKTQYSKESNFEMNDILKVEGKGTLLQNVGGI